MNKPQITIYIPCLHYGHFLSQAVESVLAQSRTDWELIIVNDGSRDDTAEVAARFEAADPKRVRVITHTEPRGLQVSANEVLQVARGQYLMRLDADDYLDDNALLVLAHYLDQHPDVALVYPNYIYVDEKGNFLAIEHRKKVGKEAQLLDLPAHGACTLVRKRVFKSIGGYDESNDRQDGYDLWLKVIDRFPVANVATPLFYYRQHSKSLTGDKERLLAARARIKRAHVQRNSGKVQPRIVAIVGAKNTYDRLQNIVLTELAGRPLLDYTLKAAFDVEGLESVVVTTDDPRVVEYSEKKYPEVLAMLRPPEFSAQGVRESMVMSRVVSDLEREGCYPDIIVTLSVHCPLRQGRHIQQAIDTLLVHKVDSVVSVYEDYELHYVHSTHGLESLNPAMHRQIRVEREALFVGNGAVRVLWRDILTETDIAGSKVGHTVMPYWDSLQIKMPQDAWLIEQILMRRQRTDEFLPEAWLMPHES